MTERTPGSETEAPQPADGEDGRAETQVPAPDLPEAYVIPRTLAQATLEYLAAQPYREVFALVRGFEALEPAPTEEPRRPA